MGQKGRVKVEVRPFEITIVVCAVAEAASVVMARKEVSCIVTEGQLTLTTNVGEVVITVLGLCTEYTDAEKRLGGRGNV